MFYQLLDLVIRHVLTWDLQRLLGLFSLPLLPSWYGLSDVYEYGKRDLQQVLAIFMALKRDSKIE